MAISSPKPVLICKKACPSMLARSKSPYSCRTLKSSESSSNNWTFSHWKTDCGIEFQRRIFKAICTSCPMWLGDKQCKPECPVKLVKDCRGNYKNGLVP